MFRTHVFLATLFCASWWSGAASAGTLSGSVSGTAYAHSPTSFTDPNAVGPAVAGVQVSIFWCKNWIPVRAVQSIVWQCNSTGSASTTTDANGRYSLSYKEGMNPPTGATGNALTFLINQNAGDEAMPPAPMKTFGGGGGKDFKRVALMRSPNNAMWLRRYGTGDYTFFYVEGFDPQNGVKTGDEAGGDSSGKKWQSILRTMRNSPLGSASLDATYHAPAGANNNMLDFLTSNNYSVYIVASGNNWKNSQAGTLADHSDGMAYQAMALIKQAQQRFSPRVPIIVGGYSLGGSVVRTGLFHWCRGDFASIAGSPLTNQCPEVGTWWSADAPLDSATVPESLIRLMKDTGLASKPMARTYVDSMNSAAARELLENWTTDGCATGCLDENGCQSAQPGYTGGCTVNNSARVAFQSWNGMPNGRLATNLHSQVQNGMPKRGSSLLPAVAFSLGRDPKGLLSDRSRPRVNDQNRFMNIHLHTNVTLFGFGVDTVDADVQMFATQEEMRSGSRLDMLDGIQTVDSGIPGSAWGVLSTDTSISNPTFDFYPTFIPARSSLLWSALETSSPPFWSDFRTNSVDANHVSPFPSNDTGMVLAWASEFSKGYHYMPVATAVKTPNLQSRPAAVEFVDGRDDDGDEEVDEMQVWDGLGITATWTDASNRWLTFVSQNRYWKYDSYEDMFVPQTGYFGQGKFVPDVPAGNASIWFNAPLVDGIKPWDGSYGITAAYTAPSTGDWNGPAQFIVLFNQNRYWVYRGGADGVQSWMAAGHVGDGIWLPRILPYFEPSYTPTYYGIYPWDYYGITGIHYNEWGTTDQINITSEGRQWTYNFDDATWSQPWERSGIITSAWTSYDRSVQCVSANNGCTWLDCKSAQYWQGDYTHVSCFGMNGGWNPINTFDIHAWGSQIAVVRNGITNIIDFTPAAGASCPNVTASTILAACKDKQICNYPLPQGCSGTARYSCASYSTSDWGQATATSGGTLGMPCPW